MFACSLLISITFYLRKQIVFARVFFSPVLKSMAKIRLTRVFIFYLSFLRLFSIVIALVSFVPAGGDSGLDEDHNDYRLDCRQICDGGWVRDNCSFCEPYSNISYTGGSKYMDCSYTCVTPGKHNFKLIV